MPQPHTGHTAVNLLDVDETAGGRSIKTSGGQLYGLIIGNISSAEVFVKFTDATTTVVGTTVPILTVMVEATTTVVVPIPGGVTFSTGIMVYATTANALADTGAPGALACNLTALIN